MFLYAEEADCDLRIVATVPAASLSSSLYELSVSYEEFAEKTEIPLSNNCVL